MATVVQPMACDNNINMNGIVVGVEEITIQPKMRRKEEEINKLFDSSKKKLASLDSQRILSVLDDSIRKLEIVTLLPYLVENLWRYSIMLGSDLCDALKNYDRLQVDYTNALSNLRKSRPKSGGKVAKDIFRSIITPKNTYNGDDDNNNEDFQKETPEGLMQQARDTVDMLGQQVSDNVKTILRLFKHNPSAINSIKDERKERASEANKMIDEINEFREQLFCRLVTNPSEECEKHKLTVQVMQREKKAQKLIKKLEIELKTTTKAKEELVSNK